MEDLKMKKKLLMFFVLLAISAGVVLACGSGGDNENGDDLKNQNQEKTLDDVEQFLKEKNVLSGEKTKTAAEMIGAIDGFKYLESNTEIYVYDTDSEEYTKLSAGEEVPIKGMEGFFVKAVSVNGKFVLMGEPSQEIIDAFDSFQ